MSRRSVSAPLELLDAAARPVIADYLDRLAASLPCARATRDAIVAEVGDGLVDAVGARVAAGLAPADAATAAVVEFGAVPVLSAQFVEELCGRAAHRAGLALVATGPVVGSVWVAAFAARSGQAWWEQLAAWWHATPPFALVLAVTIPAAVCAAVAGGGRFGYALRFGVRGVATAAVIASTGCATSDTVLLTGLVVSAGSGWTAWASAAGLLSAVRLGLAATAARRCVRLRAAVG